MLPLSATNLHQITKNTKPLKANQITMCVDTDDINSFMNIRHCKCILDLYDFMNYISKVIMQLTARVSLMKKTMSLYETGLLNLSAAIRIMKPKSAYNHKSEVLKCLFGGVCF